MEALYANGLAPLPKLESLTPFRRVYREQFHGLVLLAMGALLLEMFLPQRKRINSERDAINQRVPAMGPSRFNRRQITLHQPRIAERPEFLQLALSDTPACGSKFLQEGFFCHALIQFD